MSTTTTGSKETTPVLFTFLLSPHKTLTHTHLLPTTLITASHAPSTPSSRLAYLSAVGPIIQSHHSACLSGTQKQCSVCDVGKTVQILSTPMSFLHQNAKQGGPGVRVIVTPVCGRSECETVARAMVEEMVQSVMGPERTGPARGGPCPCGKGRQYKKCCGRNELAGVAEGGQRQEKREDWEDDVD